MQLTKEEFERLYCDICGSLRCYGVDDTRGRALCRLYNKELGQIVQIDISISEDK